MKTLERGGGLQKGFIFDGRAKPNVYSNSSSWLEMHSTVNQSASGAAAVTFVNPFARNKSPPPTAVIRTALFSQQSPCFVTSQTGGGNNDVTVKQVRCESVQLFVCGSVSESDESVPESLTKSCKVGCSHYCNMLLYYFF